MQEIVILIYFYLIFVLVDLSKKSGKSTIWTKDLQNNSLLKGRVHRKRTLQRSSLLILKE